MSTIYHLEVGGPDFIPTVEDLKKIVAEFMKPMPAYGHKINISEVFVGGLTQDRLVIQAGAKDWVPTREELDALVKQFQEAALIDQSVVATRMGVKLHLVPILPEKSGDGDE